MAFGIIIHVSVGKEKRTEFFNEEIIHIGSDESNDLQIHTPRIKEKGVWFKLERKNDSYQIVSLNKNLNLQLNKKPTSELTEIKDGDKLSIDSSNISFSFFSLKSESSLIKTNRDPHIAPFIEDAALESAATEKRDDAKAFLREFSRELMSEISLTSKLIGLTLIVGVFSGLFYLGYGFYKEFRRNRKEVEKQNVVINDLKNKIAQTNNQIDELDERNKKVIDIISLTPQIRDKYGNGICLIVGVYQLVDKKTGRVLRYPDPNAYVPELPDPNNPESDEPPMEDGSYEPPPQQTGLTTSGSGSPVEYDFIGTGFHTGDGFIVTNRHVLQPWTEDDLVKQLMRESKGRARIKKLVIYFPNYPKSFPLKVRKVSYREDLAVASIPEDSISSDIPILPLETDTDSMAIGKTVVTMGYPNGPDRLLTMVDEKEVKTIQQRFGNSRQALINYLARSNKIVPLTTQGSITDLDKRRVVHDAPTAEGGSGAPLFGQSGKVIGVNFGVFTENNASNMAVPISFALKLLREAGWQESGNKQSVDSEPKNQTTANASSAKN